MLSIVIPMTGRGSRFADEWDTEPRHLDQPMIQVMVEPAEEYNGMCGLGISSDLDFFLKHTICAEVR